jgi:hypothetical protein
VVPAQNLEMVFCSFSILNDMPVECALIPPRKRVSSPVSINVINRQHAGIVNAANRAFSS